MVTCITFHAIQRLSERRDCRHLLRHVNKIRSWGLPDDGITEHKGYRYVTRGGFSLLSFLGVSVTLNKWKQKGEKNEKQRMVQGKLRIL